MTRPLVYLSGPISGLTYEGAEDWRFVARQRLADIGIRAVSPLRGEAAHTPKQVISAHGRDYAPSPMLTPKAITKRDRFDATRCDLMLVNLLQAERVSIGTMIEFGWADAKRIPIVLAVPAGPHPHDHLMVDEIAGFRVHSLDDALDCVATILA